MVDFENPEKELLEFEPNAFEIYALILDELFIFQLLSLFYLLVFLDFLAHYRENLPNQSFY